VSGMIFIPDPPVPMLESGGDRSNKDIQAKWDRRDPAPFFAAPEADHCDVVFCIVCTAPLHTYERFEHEEGCKKILASDGKDVVDERLASALGRKAKR